MTLTDPRGPRDPIELFFELLTHTGLRISEALGLTWGNVDLGDHPCIHVREQVYLGKRKKLKTEASVASIPLSSGMARKLTESRVSHPDAPVFATKAGTPHSYGNVYNRALRPALRASGIAVQRADGTWDYQGVSFHAFRKACGSLLLAQAGKDLKQVQGWLRHSSLTTTLDVYIHEVDGGLGSADAFDEILGATGGQHTTPEQPQNGGAPSGVESAQGAENGDQPQPAVTLPADS